MTLKKYVVAVETGAQLRVTVVALLHTELRSFGASGRVVITGGGVTAPVAGGVVGAAGVDGVTPDGAAGVVCAGSA